MSGDSSGDSLTSPGRLFGLTPGQRLAGRYLIEDELGRGGMGVVYRAHDEQRGQRVAIKTILAAPGGEHVRRFRLEIRTLKSLQHPHIVTVYDSGRVHGSPFYVMEYIAGTDLSRLLAQRRGPLSVSETALIGVQIGKALAYLHNQGKIHRDIKPANIMTLQPETISPLHVKLMDFGLIKSTDVSAQLTASGVWLGTLAYLSPEQLKGLRVDRRSDLYALGLVLFELCSGGFPFQAPDPLSIAIQRLLKPAPSPREFKPDLPLVLEQVILKLLSQNLNQRYALAEELLADLAPLADVALSLESAPLPRADFVARPPLVGRDEELNCLVSWLHAAWNGPAGCFALIEGEAGVGKTRLMQELGGLVRLQKGRRLQGVCYEEERLPYGPFTEMLREVVKEERFAPLLKGLRTELSRLVPALAPSLEQAPALEPEQARLRLFDAVARFLVRLSRRRPIALILDDLQWADEGTLELLHYLARNVQDAPIFICGTARQEELYEKHPLLTLLQALSRRGLAERLALERLSSEAVADLVGGMLAGGAPPTLLAERLYGEAEGNPFFVQEILRAWIEEGLLAREIGHWYLVANGVSKSLPAGIADIVAYRLGRVSGVGQDVLRLAAVLGREFNFDVLLNMTPGIDEDELLDAIEDLLRARLLEEVRHSREDRYRFTHNKIQEVIYGQASTSQRRLRRLHREAGEALEKVYAGRLEHVIGPLARHFALAGDRRGVDYGLQAGDAARAVYANQEALGYYRQALTLAQDLRERGENEALLEQIVALHTGIARIHFLVGQYEAASKYYRAVLELLPQAELESDELRQQICAAHRRLSDVYEAQGNYEQAMAELRAAQAALPTTAGPSRELALIYMGIGWLQMRQGEYQEAIVNCNQGLRIAPPGDYAVVADLDDTLGVIYRSQDEYVHATACHQRSLDLREQLGDRAGIAKTYNNLALAGWRQGDYEQAVAYYQRSLTISKDIGHSLGEAFIYNNLGLIYVEQGQYDSAIQHYEQALSISEQIGNNLIVAMAYGNLGEVYRDQGNLPRAQEYLKLALSKSQEIRDREGLAYAHHLLAEIYLDQGDLTQALHSGQQALDIADEIGARFYQAHARKVLGQAYLLLDQPDQALAYIQVARRLFDELGDEEGIAATEAALHALPDEKD